MILLTGGTGLIGSHLLYYLLKEHSSVRVIFRNPDNKNQTKFIFRFLSSLEHDSEIWTEKYERISWVKAEITDSYTMAEMLSGIKLIYHAAATVSFNQKDRKEILWNNVMGTTRLVDAALEAQVEKIAYISSVAALAKKPNAVTTEKDIIEGREFSSAYSESKYRAEMEIWRGHTEGLSATIINPSVVLGAGDFSKSSSQIFKTIAEGLNFYPTGSNAYVDARDVAKCLIALSKTPEAYGQRFIASSTNISYKDLFQKIATQLGIEPPQYKAGKTLSEMVWILAGMKGFLTGKAPFISKSLARTSLENYAYNSNKLKDLLQYEFLPFDRTIEDTAKAYELWKNIQTKSLY